MQNHGFKPRKLHGSLSTKVRKFQELYEEIMEEIHPRSNEQQVEEIDSKQLRSLSPNTFSRLVHENFADKIPEKKSLFSDIT